MVMHDVPARTERPDHSAAGGEDRAYRFRPPAAEMLHADSITRNGACWPTMKVASINAEEA